MGTGELEFLGTPSHFLSSNVGEGQADIGRREMGQGRGSGLGRWDRLLGEMPLTGQLPAGAGWHQCESQGRPGPVGTAVRPLHTPECLHLLGSLVLAATFPSRLPPAPVVGSQDPQPGGVILAEAGQDFDRHVDVLWVVGNPGLQRAAPLLRAFWRTTGTEQRGALGRA